MVAYSLEPNNQQVQHLQPYYNSIIFIDSILLQCLHTHALQRPLIRSLEHNLRHLLIIIPRGRFAVARAGEACEWLCGVERERLLEYCNVSEGGLD